MSNTPETRTQLIHEREAHAGAICLRDHATLNLVRTSRHFAVLLLMISAAADYQCSSQAIRYNNLSADVVVQLRRGRSDARPTTHLQLDQR